MKKFYSIVLMAAALLIGTNVNAAKIAEMTIGGATTDVENLWDAFRSVPANATATIKMVDDATINPGEGAVSGTPILWVNAGQNITLDLNGHDIHSNARFNFGHASFTLTGAGTYNCSVNQAFNCYGSEDPNAPYGWSAITIGKDVTLNDPAGYALGILYAGSRDGYGATAVPSKNNPLSHADSLKYFSSCGVQVDVYGKLISKYGVASNGNMKFNEGNIPVLNIHPTALVQGDNNLETIYGKTKAEGGTGEEQAVNNAADAPIVPDGEPNAGKKYYKTTNAGLYCAGYMKYNIFGTVTGGVGVYVKAGEVNIKDATVMATSAEMWTPIKYSNGFIGAGSAIIFDSNSSYSPEGMSIDVTGDSYVSSTSGYAIQDLITSGAEKLEANDINIESGTFVGATVTDPETGTTETLCINFTHDLGDDIKQAGSISGGTFNSTDVQDYINTMGDGIIVPVETADGTVYVVAEKPAGTTWETDLNAAAADAYVKLDAAGTTELSADKDIDYLNITAAHIVVIPSGKTLTVGEIVLSEDAVIDVKAGGLLIVDGKNGIVAFNDNNLVLESSATGSAVFLLQPNVVSNKNPHATVQVYAKANYDGVTWRSQHFTIPTLEAPSAMSIPAGGTTSLFKWTSAGWEEVPNRSSLNESFRGYRINFSGATEAGIYTFKGRTVGNSNGVLNFNKTNYNLFGNSFTAPMSLEAFFTALEAAGNGVDFSIWIYNSATDQHISVNKADIDDHIADVVTIAPMQGFIMYSGNNSGVTREINYKDAVWDNPQKTGVPIMAPVKRSNSSVIATLVINSEKSADKVTLREREYCSDQFDNGLDARKLMSERSFNFYANNAEDNLSQVATNNLEGQTFSLQAADEMVYTLSFENVRNFGYALRDNETKAIISIVEGETYTFNVIPGTTAEERFELVSVKNAPTAIDNTESFKAAKGIYTILGQYVCESSELNNLPKGIYVVDGQKIVK